MAQFGTAHATGGFGLPPHVDRPYGAVEYHPAPGGGLQAVATIA